MALWKRAQSLEEKLFRPYQVFQAFGTTRRSQEEPGGARRSQEEPGGSRRNQLAGRMQAGTLRAGMATSQDDAGGCQLASSGSLPCSSRKSAMQQQEEAANWPAVGQCMTLQEVCHAAAPETQKGQPTLHRPCKGLSLSRWLRRRQEVPGGARRSQEEPGEARRSQEDPGGIS